MADDPRPNSSLRGRSTRRGAPAAAPDAAGSAAADAAEEADDSASAPWKVELESIMSGTHPLLMEALAPHEAKMKAVVGQADKMRQLQIVNIDALFECEKKQAEDETRAQLEFFKSRLIDAIEEKRKKASEQQHMGMRRLGAETGKGAAGANGKRKRDGAGGGDDENGAPSLLPASFALKPEELKADLEEINTNVDHYSVRSAAAASDEMRSTTTTAEAWFDRSRQLLHCNGQSYDRGAAVIVYSQGQRVDDEWTLTAMNAVEVTLRDAEGVKLKVTLAQLRNGRYAFRPVLSQW